MTLDAGRRPSASRSLLAGVLALAIVIGFATSVVAVAQDSGGDQAEAAQSAPVVIDGETLFYLRGVTAFPAKERAATVKGKIIELAKDASFDVKNLTIGEADDRTTIYAGATAVLSIVDVDAAAEELERPLLAQINKARIAQSIEEYRRARSPATLIAP